LRQLGCLGGIQAPLLTRAFHTRASRPLARQVACPHRGLARKPQGSARASAMRIARSARFARDIGFSSDELAVVCAAPPWKAVTRPPSSLERGPSVGVQDLPGTVRQHHAVDYLRRIFTLPAGSGEGPLTEPTAAAQPWRRERVLMPLSGHPPWLVDRLGGKRLYPTDAMRDPTSATD
jgi:hypothetical protein